MNLAESRIYQFILILIFLSLVGASYQAHSNEALGTKKIAVVLLDYIGNEYDANNGTRPKPSTIEEGMFGAPNSVANFIDFSSYGKTKITGDVFGWIIPENPLYGTGWTACWPLDKDRFKMLLDNYPDVNLLDYDGFLFYVRRDDHTLLLNDQKCAFGNSSFGPGPRNTYTRFGTIETRVSYAGTDFALPPTIPRSQITNETIAHELIHSLGITSHSNGYYCGDQILSTDYRDCEILSKSDIFSIMGWRTLASTPNAVNKERLGWLDETSLTLADKDGSYTIHAAENQSNNVKAIKIPLDNPIYLENLQFNYLYVEYLGMRDYNYRIQRNIALDDGSYFVLTDIHGALVYGVDCNTWEYCMPYLLDMHPNSLDVRYYTDYFADAFLYKGETFDIPSSDKRLTVTSLDEGNSITVKLSSIKCPSKIDLQAIPTPGSPSHIDWTTATIKFFLTDQSDASGCDVCTYKNDITYSISSEQPFTAPAEIELDAVTTYGGSATLWNQSSSGPIPNVDAAGSPHFALYQQAGYEHRFTDAQCQRQATIEMRRKTLSNSRSALQRLRRSPLTRKSQ